MAGNGLEPILSVRDLETHFLLDEGTVHAVDGANFELYPGRTLGIVGESGCGKTVTALSILMLVERPGRIVGGQILLRNASSAGTEREIDLTQLDPDGKEMRAIRGSEIALIFQEPMTSLSLAHTIGNQIIEAIMLHQPLDKDAARQRAIETLRSVGIPQPERSIDMYPFQLSGGLRQRAMIAMALSCDPNVLIADEPTTALDVTTQAQILDLLRELQEQRGMAVILITHNMGVIAEMADDVVVMYLGKVVENGPVDEIFHAPKHPYTRDLLRAIPSIMAPPRTRLFTITGSVPHPYARPPGCPFHSRCTDYMEGVCEQREPGQVQVGKQHVSCFLYEGA